MRDQKTKAFADDDKQSVRVLALMRIPSLILGLALGFGLSFAVSRFEEVLANNVQAAFFIPFVVYMADAVGTQTQAIYTRDLAGKTARFGTYLVKETSLGIVLGVIFGIVAAGAAMMWLGNVRLAITVGLTMFVAVATAPVVAILVAEVFQIEHNDPAVGAGPIATVIQDAISIVVYGLVASWLLLSGID